MVKKSILHANQDFVSKLQTRMTAIVDGVALQIFCLIWVCLVLIHCWQMMLWLLHVYGLLVLIV